MPTLYVISLHDIHSKGVDVHNRTILLLTLDGSCCNLWSMQWRIPTAQEV